MEYMDVDQILDVPDTPDRIPAQNSFWGNYSSVTNHSRAKDLPDEGVRNRPTENGTQRLLFRPSKSPSISDKSDRHAGSSVSPSVTNHSQAKDLSDEGVRNQLPTENGTQRLLFRPSKSPNFSDKSDHHVSSSGSTSVSNHSRAKDLSDEGVINQLPTENGTQRILYRPSKSPNISDKSNRHVGSSVSTSVTNHSRAKDISDEGVRNRPTEKGTQRLLFRPSKSPSISDKSDRHVGSSVSTSVTNHSRAKDLSDEGVINRPTENGTQRLLFRPSKSLNISDKSDRHDSSSVTTLRNSSSPKNALPLKRKEKGKGICTSNSDRAEEFQKLFIPTNALSSSRSPPKSSSEGNVDEKCKPGLSSDRGKGICLVDDSQPKVGKIAQRRLVRNGCISPLNIAKVKQSTDNPNNSPVRVEPGDLGTVASEGQPGQINIRDLVSEPIDSHRVRGKTVINHPLPSKGPDGISSRGSKTSNEKNTDGTGNSSGDGYKSVGEDLGGWRSTRNRTKNTNPPSSSVPPFMQTVQPANARFKRQKQGPTSSAHGECSTSNFDDSELVCLGSSGEPSNLRSTGARYRNGPGSLDPVIEIDEFSPQARNSSSSNLGISRNDDSEIRARQLEADEMLARELQEELYNEVPVVGAPVGQIDADIALALQQQETSQRAVPSRSRAVRPRNPLISNLRRQSQSSSSRNPTIRRGTPVRAPTSTRMARLRARFPGQPRTLSSSSSSSSSRGGNPLFPPNMDLDMRMHILETLEAFSDMGMPGGALQVQRDFNENDYEMLLALDENNHQHGGASVAQINGLPQSTVQSENHQEVCAICLDTPTIGDTIRHLPCFHKFHKDCIDPWLRRKTSCPVCKSSIT